MLRWPQTVLGPQNNGRNNVLCNSQLAGAHRLGLVVHTGRIIQPDTGMLRQCVHGSVLSLPFSRAGSTLLIEERGFLHKHIRIGACCKVSGDMHLQSERWQAHSLTGVIGLWTEAGWVLHSTLTLLVCGQIGQCCLPHVDSDCDCWQLIPQFNVGHRRRGTVKSGKRKYNSRVKWYSCSCFNAALRHLPG